MVLRQKYVEENNKVSLSIDVLFILAEESDKVCDQIFSALETIDNIFKGKKSLSHRIVDDNGDPMYIKINFISKKEGEYDVMEIKEIPVDEYLDMINSKSIIRLNKRNLRIIT
jgi:hypothetical protein